MVRAGKLIWLVLLLVGCVRVLVLVDSPGNKVERRIERHGLEFGMQDRGTGERNDADKP